MNYNDYNRPITAEDLIRRYDLNNLKATKETVKKITETLNKEYILIKQFVNNISNYRNETDKLSVFFYSGIPTTENEPFINFTEEEKEEKIGSLYYDRESGYAYQLTHDSSMDSYSWELIENDSVLVQSLALANSEADTQDNVRNIYYSDPIPPYATGDIWINDNVIMRCRCSRDGGNYNSIDWVVEEDYSDSSVVLDVRAVLNAFEEKVENDYATTAALETTANSINGRVTSLTTRTTTLEGQIVNKAETSTVTALSLEVDGVSAEVAKKINDADLTSGEIFLRINGDGTSSGIKADKILLSANDVLNLIAGNTINLTSKNIVIDSTYFKVDKNGNVTANSLTSSDATITGGSLQLTSTTSNPKCDILSTTSGTYTRIFGGSIRLMYGNVGKVVMGSSTGSGVITVYDSSGNNNTNISGASITAPKITAGNIASGQCTLNSSSEVSVSFGKTFPNTPRVVLTPNTSASGVIAPKLRSVSTTGFTAIIGGSGFSNIICDWIAISN